MLTLMRSTSELHHGINSRGAILQLEMQLVGRRSLGITSAWWYRIDSTAVEPEFATVSVSFRAARRALDRAMVIYDRGANDPIGDHYGVSGMQAEAAMRRAAAFMFRACMRLHVRPSELARYLRQCLREEKKYPVIPKHQMEFWSPKASDDLQCLFVLMDSIGVAI